MPDVLCIVHLHQNSHFFWLSVVLPRYIASHCCFLTNNHSQNDSTFHDVCRWTSWQWQPVVSRHVKERLSTSHLIVSSCMDPFISGIQFEHLCLVNKKIFFSLCGPECYLFCWCSEQYCILMATISMSFQVLLDTCWWHSESDLWIYIKSII